MAKLKKVWLYSVGDRNELRMDWDNDRHQRVLLESLNPKDVRDALEEMRYLLESEIAAKRLQ